MSENTLPMLLCLQPFYYCVLALEVIKKSLTFTTRAPNTLVSSLCLLRADAVVSFDGKHSEPLNRGQILRVAMSNNPLPTVNRVDDTTRATDAAITTGASVKSVKTRGDTKNQKFCSRFQNHHLLGESAIKHRCFSYKP